MKNTKKRTKFKVKKLNHEFTGQQITKYAGLSPVMQYICKLKLPTELNELFPTVKHNATKFGISQIMVCIILASQAGVNRLSKIANFSHDILIMTLLGLKCGINKDAISSRLKGLGQAGAINLHEYLLEKSKKWIQKSNLKSVTLDCDSTVFSTCGNQEGAAKGFNSSKKGSKSYHPLLAFIGEMKLLANSWFRTGSAYTANGICEFIKETAAMLPSTVEKVFFRADSGFFNGDLFDLLEELKYAYLVKVKLYSNIKHMLNNEIEWKSYKESDEIFIGEFDFKGQKWSKSRKLKVIRTVKEIKECQLLDRVQLIPVYSYAVYCSSLDLNAFELHEKYKERSTSETWIEQVKTQLLAGKTLTNNFDANDIIWQLNALAYNLSIMMRIKWKKFWREEHNTFRDWFIDVPAILKKGGNRLVLKIYENFYFKEKWQEFENLLLQ